MQKVAAKSFNAFQQPIGVSYITILIQSKQNYFQQNRFLRAEVCKILSIED